MSICKDKFSISELPSLLPQLVKGARDGLQLNPKKLAPLRTLGKFFQLPSCDFNKTMPLARTTLQYQVLGQVKGAAESYIQKFGQVQDLLSASSVNTTALKTLMKDLSTANRAFTTSYIEKYKQTCPDEPFTILSKYPKTLNLFLSAFVSELQGISKERYASWSESAGNRSDLIPIFSSLAIRKLLEKPEATIPELLTSRAGEIGQLRALYKNLTSNEKKGLFSGLLDCKAPENQKSKQLFRKISELQYRLRGRDFNGVLRLVYEEVDKYFNLLKKMPCLDSPSAGVKCRAVLLAALKQGSNEPLPLILKTVKAQSNLAALRERFQEFSDKEEFEKLFLREKDDSKSKEMYELLQDSKDLLFDWNLVFPTHLLALIARS